MTKNLSQRMSTSMKRALRVLKKVDLSSLRREHLKDIYVEAYSNGREQGYSVCARALKLSVAESRGSDSIVVYVGSYMDFSMQGNVPNERVYRDQAHYFPSGPEAEAEAAAAAFIQDIVFKAVRGA